MPECYNSDALEVQSDTRLCRGISPQVCTVRASSKQRISTTVYQLVSSPLEKMAGHADKQQTRLRYIDEFLRLSSAPMMLEV